MEPELRQMAHGYLRAARGGLGKPEKFSPEALFQLTALALEGYWISWLEDRGGAPSLHGFPHLIRAAEKVAPVPRDLRDRVLALGRFQKLCEWIPVEPRRPGWEDIPGLLALADEVREFTDDRRAQA